MSCVQLRGELDPLHTAAGQRSVANLSTGRACVSLMQSTCCTIC